MASQFITQKAVFAAPWRLGLELCLGGGWSLLERDKEEIASSCLPVFAFRLYRGYRGTVAWKVFWGVFLAFLSHILTKPDDLREDVPKLFLPAVF